MRFIVSTEGEEIHGLFQDLGKSRSRERVNKALDDIEVPNSKMGPIAARLRAVATSDPDCLEAFATLGNLYFTHGIYRSALEWYERAVERALKAIPDSFSGRIDWSSLDNRPFLRCHHGLACTLMQLGDWVRCVPMLEKHLHWNPNDNQGVRFLLGDGYIQTSRYQDALKQLSLVKDQYPPARYSLAWIYFNQDKYPEALTELRKGFLENIYIAELIAGAIYPAKHRYWHGSNYAEPELAREHYEQFIAHKWSPAENEFVAWALRCARGLSERGAFRKYQEILSYEHDITERGKVLEEMSALLERITVESSTSWIRRMKNRRGTEHWVWEREAYV